jgi:hypothetical protein
MGTEIVFVFIYPVTLICLAAAIWFWFTVVKAKQQPTVIGYITGYLPLAVGFAISMAGLALITYMERAANFAWLIEHGYYTESQRSTYLPARVAGQATLNLVFVLPAICFIVIPCTARLIKTSRLTLGAIGLRVWVGLRCRLSTGY